MYEKNIRLGLGYIEQLDSRVVSNTSKILKRKQITTYSTSQSHHPLLFPIRQELNATNGSIGIIATQMFYLSIMSIDRMKILI